MRRFLLPLLILFFSLGCGGADVPGMEQLDLPKQDDTSPKQDVDTLAPSDRLKNDVQDTDEPDTPPQTDPGEVDEKDTQGGDDPGDTHEIEQPDIEIVDIELPYPLCQPCRTDLDCKGSADNSICIPDENLGSWCGIACTATTDCPGDFVCRRVRDDIQQCIPPEGESCPCLKRYVDAGFVTTCWIENEWGRCEQERRCDQLCTVKTPEREVCNGIDDNCDGNIDEGLGSTTCGLGECEVTVQNCVDGRTVECVPLEPSKEICDGKDNDCNGEIDDKIPDLTCGVGICENTVPACVDGRPQVCHPKPSSFEECNGLDDDCNGEIDDMGTVTCGVRACQITVERCVDGVLNECIAREPTDEVCNGIDDDCDGEIDNDIPPITCGTGACQRTVTACIDGVPQACIPGLPSEEVCDGIDNDCNGEVDDMGTTTCGLGVCERTVENCVDGVEQTCVPGRPGTETCNGLDDDCDGTKDEDVCPCPTREFGGHVYMFCNSTFYWRTARDRCRQSPSYDLVSILSAEENKWVTETARSFSNNVWWIGLNDRDKEGTFLWSNDDPVVYTSWASGEPNNGGNWRNEHCVVTNYGGVERWNDDQCTRTFRYICKSK